MTNERRSKVEELPAAGVHSIAHLLPKSQGRCGIYVLSFANGDRYVGQAGDVAMRFAAHRRIYSDIEEVAFRRVPRAQLDAAERAEIQRLEGQGVPLRNVVLTSGRLGASDFDVVVTPQEQEAWLESKLSSDVGADDRPQHPQLRRGNHAKFTRLAADPRFANLVHGLRRYVAWTVPYPRRTELSYWSISAMPSTNATPSFGRLLTLSVHAMETLWAAGPREDHTEIEININVDLAMMLARWGTIDRLTEQADWLFAMDGGYRVRPGALRLGVRSVRDLVRTLSLDGVVAAARRLNLDLMRKGPALNWKSHCLDLADCILDPVVDDPPELDADDSESLFNAGLTRDERGDLEEAEAFYRCALDADQGNTQAALRLGRLYAERRDLDEAETYYRRAADAGNIDALHHLGSLHIQRGQFDQAVVYCQRAAEAGNVDAMLNLGLLLQGHGDLDQAETWYRRAAEAGNPQALNPLGLLYQEQGDLDQAETYLRRGADTGDLPAMINLGVLLHDRGDLDGAEELYLRVWRAGGEDNVALNLADIHHERGELEPAEMLYRHATEIGDAHAAVSLGLLLQERGDIDEADTHYRRAADSGDAEVLDRLRDAGVDLRRLSAGNGRPTRGD